MATPIVIPNVGESVTSGVIAAWRKKDGEFAQRDDVLLDLETDKITMEVRAPAAGVVKRLAKEGDTVEIGAKVGEIDESAAPPASSKGSAAVPAAAQSMTDRAEKPARVEAPAPPRAGPAPGRQAPPRVVQEQEDIRATPLAKKLAEERGIDLAKVHGSGPGSRVREQDVLAFTKDGQPKPNPAAAAEKNITAVDAVAQVRSGDRQIVRERMSPLRQRIAQRLVEAQHTAAMLTTFNECDMSAVLAVRAQYKETFEKRYGIGLGFMSFFVRAAVAALQTYPLVNSFLVEDEEGKPAIQKHSFCDIAVAVASPKGLVVPVIRNAEILSFAQIEQQVKDLATRAKEGKLTLEEMQGGTFTITNGGVFGSLMSTPILNPPQAGILGMHAIKNRAVEDPQNSGQVVVRPMMYLALSYDHRIIDGAEAVRFLVKIKEGIEDPRRLLLEV